MVIATDDDLDIDMKYNFDVSDNEMILADDYCPIEAFYNYK